MWLCNSSIGRKVIMSVTGIALILFLTFHACMNLVALFSAEGYNMVCEMLGANWYAVAATAGLAALVALHFVYAVILTLQNRKARGASRYAVTDRPEKVEWAAQNMFVLGVIVVVGMLLHLYNFWFNMMFAELANGGMPYINEVASASDGYGMIAYTFSNPVFTVLYLIWFAAIWFHMTHGFWSAFQTLGWNGKTWFCRWKAIGMAYVTVLMLIFVTVALKFAFCGGCC
ncbi:MAG TPA: succinate dehydrogenase cytochrome b subunit [Alloprevotella sp.]|uniref:succinate dehydrogenase cytochrome b subunit n=1 Tax=uncultured Bacteroides sp. TaxID=162156 RepID=UPI00259B6AEE|nr:succinate dehydrogenase cytochrome b subunit [uncultured Bacteroides sp.]HRF86684.1 succinate dehydrogenase cytochrome b subunit [Alloprevotella sp.]